MWHSVFAACYVLAAIVHAASISNAASPPAVHLDNGTFIGSTDGSTDSFLGIKFADAPRFQLPIPVDPYTGTVNASQFGPSCPQQGSLGVRSVVDDPDAGIYVTALRAPTEQGLPPSEDCLNLNVWAPSNMTSNGPLPVVVWIYGGGFQLGSTDSYDGGIIVERSIELGEPVVYVSMNYRVSAFGFLAGKEVKEAGIGNIGLEDQRAALRWVQKYIGAFGGDPTRVTIWGESAGAISVALQMLTNGGDTDGLFHGAFMQSGAPIPVGDIANGQPEYDALVANTSCDQAQDSLDCLRNVTYDVLKAAVDKSPSIVSYQSLRLAWLPRADGRFLSDHPQKLVQNGSVAPIPFVSGNCDDEGTVFSIINALVIKNETQFREYMLSNYITGATEDDAGDLFDLYPDIPALGSPFDTGPERVLGQYKRLAAIQGDLVFQAPRRFFLNNTAHAQPTWTFLSKRLKDTNVLGFPLGSTHGSDISNVYGPGDMTDYLVHFANHGDPNDPAGKLLQWPQYDTESRNQLVFLDGDIPLNVSTDDYRAPGFDKLTELSLEFPL